MTVYSTHCRPEALARYFRQLDGEGGVDIDSDEEERARLGDGDEEEEVSILWFLWMVIGKGCKGTCRVRTCDTN